MFDKITKNLTKKVITNAKETVKDKVDNSLPIVLGLISVGVVLISMFGGQKKKAIQASTITINNYYIYLGGDK